MLEYTNRGDGEAFYNLGMVYRKMKNSPTIKAIRHFDDAIKLLKGIDLFQALL